MTMRSNLQDVDGRNYTACYNTAYYADTSQFGDPLDTNLWRWCLERSMNTPGVLGFDYEPDETYNPFLGTCTILDSNTAQDLSKTRSPSTIIAFFTCNDITAKREIDCIKDSKNTVAANSAVACTTNASRKTVYRAAGNEQFVYTVCYPGRDIALFQEPFPSCIRRCILTPSCIGLYADTTMKDTDAGCSLRRDAPRPSELTASNFIAFFTCKYLDPGIPMDTCLDQSNNAYVTCSIDTSTGTVATLAVGITYRTCSGEASNGATLGVLVDSPTLAGCMEMCAQISGCVAANRDASKGRGQCTFLQKIEDDRSYADPQITTAWLICKDIPVANRPTSCRVVSPNAAKNCLGGVGDTGEGWTVPEKRTYRYCLGQEFQSATLISSSTTTTVNECARTCSSDTNCVAFTLATRTGVCSIYSGMGTGEALAAFAVSGWFRCNSSASHLVFGLHIDMNYILQLYLNNKALPCIESRVRSKAD